jgi:hypothetical protein
MSAIPKLDEGFVLNAMNTPLSRELTPKILLLLGVLWAATASADPPATPAAAPPDSAGQVLVPPMPCIAPKIPQRVSVAREDVEYLQKQAHIYGECVKKYIDERQAHITFLGNQQKAEAEAANTAAKDVNDYLDEVREFAKKNTH